MTLVKDDKSSDAPKSKPDRRKEKKPITTTTTATTKAGPVENLKKSVEIVEEDQDLSGPSSGVREGFNKKDNNLLIMTRSSSSMSSSHMS